MNLEGELTTKTSSPEKKKLIELEKSEQYVFHGSGYDLAELEPRQAIDLKKGKDGPPAVFASTKVDYAIFMAIINRVNVPKGARSNAGATSHDDGSIEMKFKTTKAVLDSLQETAHGYVYVFYRSDFKQRGKGGVEFVSYIPTQWIDVVPVRRGDLPSPI